MNCLPRGQGQSLGSLVLVPIIIIVNKLKFKKKTTGCAHLTKNLRKVALFGATLTDYNSGKNGKNANFVGPIIKPARSRFWGKKSLTNICINH